MARPEEKALRLTLIAAFALTAIFAATLYLRAPGRDAQQDRAKQDQSLIATVQSTSPVSGPQNAPVTMAEFSDFQCPYCKDMAPLLARAMQEYGDKIRRVYIHVTNVSEHPQSENAAVASQCAAQQGQFWPYHDALLDAQDKLGPATYNQIALTLKLDLKAFQDCSQSQQTIDTVRAHTQFAQRAGVTTTPYVTINNEALTGVFTYEQLKAAIDRSL